MDDLTKNEIFLRFDEPETSRAVVLEDDGRVAYAYLLDGGDIISDVWLYNVNEAPDSVNWSDKSTMPFLNPKQFCDVDHFPKLSKQSNVMCNWMQDGVIIKIDNLVMAVLERDHRPGWSRLARLSNPLAQPLISYPFIGELA